MRQQTSMRLSATTIELRMALADKLGISASAVTELAIRRLAEIEHVTLKAAPRPTPQKRRTPTK